MKVSSFVVSCAMMVASSSAFTTSTSRPTLTRNYMFSGGGANAPKEDNPEAYAQMEQAAKAMGMSVAEYQLGMNARERLNDELSEMRIVNGNTDTVAVERDGHNPPQHMKITITEAGKAMGKADVSTELVGALKAGADESRTGRAAAQKNMMQYIADEMKKMEGKA